MRNPSQIPMLVKLFPVQLYYTDIIVHAQKTLKRFFLI